MKMRSVVAVLALLAWASAPGVVAQQDKDAPLDLSAPPAKKSVKRAKKETPVTPVSAAEAVRRANAYFDVAQTMIADFTQKGADGRRAQGKLYISKPGRMLFAYDPPAPLEIVSDGATVVVQDLKLGTADKYSIGQTPLKFLLQEHMDLAGQTKVLGVDSQPKITAVEIEDSSTFGGTSKVDLVFDTRSFKLRKWVVHDSQGYETTVELSNIDLKTPPDPRLFQLHADRIKAGVGIN